MLTQISKYPSRSTKVLAQVYGLLPPSSCCSGEGCGKVARIHLRLALHHWGMTILLRTVKRRFLFPLRILEALKETASKGQVMQTFSAPAETASKGQIMQTFLAPAETTARGAIPSGWFKPVFPKIARLLLDCAGPSVETLTFFVPASKSTEATAQGSKPKHLVWQTGLQ